ncbi:MAG TPA: DNA methyltransferase [Pirellulales bacterium]|nr:DNA methyltransferase [Pirellulales bacterium]
MTPQEFIAKWQRVNLTERSACQQHFLDLCDLLVQPKPAAADPEGAWYTFERGVSKTGGGQGWADVWMRGHFGWEYKGKHKDLAAAYKQLLLYREDLDNPPLLVVCDLDRFEIHTNFTGTAKQVYEFDLDSLAEPANLDVLRKLFTEPDALRPGETTESVTRQAAERFGMLADGMRVRGIPALSAAHFLMKLIFCMFAEDIGLLPPKLFNRILAGAKDDPPRLAVMLGRLFEAMAQGGDFGADPILFFNGGLFADAEVIELRPSEIKELLLVNERDWGSVEPSIFGTLFERTLDPAKRSQIGAHYTSREDILTLLEPVVMTPLRREWAEVKAKCEKLAERFKGAAAGKRTAPSKARKDHDRLLLDFVERLAHVSILDPACGSGNFLYVAINLLLDLEKEVITYAAGRGLGMLPHVRPTQLAGIEINPYAQQLAQVVIWIGYLQWMHDNGFNAPRDPVLEPIESIRLMDAIIDLSDPEHPKEPEWPAADFIVGNPPFLGGKLLRTNLGDEYVRTMFATWDGRVPHEADLCCYWFEKARRQIELGKCHRAGLLATQGIRGGANRKVLEATKATGDIFFAVSDRDWILDGAAVHVSMVGFDNGTESRRELDGVLVRTINANLRATADTTKAQRLGENLRLSFMGDTKGGAFDIPEDIAFEMLRIPNPDGCANSDVIVPWANGLDVTRRSRGMWIIDFGVNMPVHKAALYAAPYEYLEKRVRPEREKNKRQSYREKWWVHVEPRPAMRAAMQPLARFAVTISVGKHRLFVWMAQPTLPDHQLFVFTRSDDAFLGLVHSRVHEVWARVQGTQVRERESGFRYTPTSCFETFPFPGEHDGSAVAEAARELDRLRNGFLNPPEWTREEILEFPGSADGPWARYVHEPDGRGIGVVRYPRLVAKDAECAKLLAKRTLTNLYNQRPAWLDRAHRRLDEAVFAAYGWPADLAADELLARLLELNLQRAAAE